MTQSTPEAAVHYRRNDAETRCGTTGLTTRQGYFCQCGKSAEWLIIVAAPGALAGTVAACDGCARIARADLGELLRRCLALPDAAVTFRPVPQTVTL